MVAVVAEMPLAPVDRSHTLQQSLPLTESLYLASTCFASLIPVFCLTLKAFVFATLASSETIKI